MDVGEFGARRLYTGLRLDYRLSVGSYIRITRYFCGSWASCYKLVPCGVNYRETTQTFV